MKWVVSCTMLQYNVCDCIMQPQNLVKKKERIFRLSNVNWGKCPTSDWVEAAERGVL